MTYRRKDFQIDNWTNGPAAQCIHCGATHFVHKAVSKQTTRKAWRGVKHTASCALLKASTESKR